VGKSVPGFAGRTGYAIAQCNFQNAYAFAEISYNFSLASGFAYGYAAYILPNPALYHRTPAGGGLGENAIAPVNIDRQILNLLMYGDPSKK
jgi:Na+-driven multidrug efflux pump